MNRNYSISCILTGFTKLAVAGNAFDLSMSNLRVASEGAVAYSAVPVAKWHPLFLVAVSSLSTVRSNIQTPVFDYARANYFGQYMHLSGTEWDTCF